MNKPSNQSAILSPVLATVIAEVLTLPICTVKTRYQNTKNISIPDTVQQLYNQSGIKGFYKASYSAIGSQILSTTSKYFIYSELKHITGRNSNSDLILFGMISGGLSTIISHPFDTIKIHIQMKPVEAIKDIRSQGYKLLYRGYSKSLSKAVIGSSLFFPIYDMTQKRVNNPAISALVSSVISTTILHPIDYLKVRHIYGQELYQSWNPLRYYKGYILNLSRIVPHFIITMTCIEYFNRL